MKKLGAILLLICLISVQYAYILSNLNCRPTVQSQPGISCSCHAAPGHADRDGGITFSINLKWNEFATHKTEIVFAPQTRKITTKNYLNNYSFSYYNAVFHPPA